MMPRENYADSDVIDAEDRSRRRVQRTTRFPTPPAASVYQGVIGELVETLAPHTESDPVALLVQALVCFGSIIGRRAHFLADGALHYTNLYAVLVGRTAKGRKGTSWAHIKRLFRQIDPVWRIESGLASGEGLIYHVRDASYSQRGSRNGSAGDPVMDDAGVSDKRVLIAESEFAKVLRQLEREHSTLSPVLRDAWDHGELSTLTKNSPMKATGAHISIIGHITAEELQRYLTATEAANGFGNRFLWLCVQRSKLLPDGGDARIGTRLADALRDAVSFARNVDCMTRDDAARALWHSAYEKLSAGGYGLLASMTGRAEAQVMRLACVYALSDCSDVVERVHLRAALDLWDYCERSARYLFGESVGDSLADEILKALKLAGAVGLTRTEISYELGRNKTAHEISRALERLEELGLAHVDIDRSGAGRPVERWFADLTR